MAEDAAELALEAIDPFLNRREVWQKAKSKVKGRLPDVQNPESSRRKIESDDEQTRYRDTDIRDSRNGKQNRRQRQYEDESWREEDIDPNYTTTNALSDRHQSHRSSTKRPEIQRRASSMDRGDFEKYHGRRRQREGSQRGDRGRQGENTASRRASQRIDSKDALAAGVAGLAAIYLASGLYKDHKNKGTRRGPDAAS